MKNETPTLGDLETIIGNGERSALESGKALKTIRVNRLYKPEHPTFDSYLAKRWGMSRQRCQQLIQLADTAQRLSKIVDTSKLKESHVRELAKLDTARQPDAVKKFMESGAKLTAERMKSIVSATHRTPIGTGVDDLEEIKPTARTGLNSPIGYYGAKKNLAPWILDLMPPHDNYIEPFFGGGSILFSKPPSKIELINDVNHGVVNFFSVLRDSKLAKQLQKLCALTPYSREEHRRCQDPPCRGRKGIGGATANRDVVV